jgi:hypothetical protein
MKDPPVPMRPTYVDGRAATYSGSHPKERLGFSCLAGPSSRCPEAAVSRRFGLQVRNHDPRSTGPRTPRGETLRLSCRSAVRPAPGTVRRDREHRPGGCDHLHGSAAGGVAERSNAAVLKTVGPDHPVPRVRIPPPPLRRAANARGASAPAVARRRRPTRARSRAAAGRRGVRSSGERFAARQAAAVRIWMCTSLSGRHVRLLAAATRRACGGWSSGRLAERGPAVTAMARVIRRAPCPA